MPASRRPYQKLKAEELCEEGDRLLSLGDKAKLKDLLEELSYRSRSRRKLDPLAQKIELNLATKTSDLESKSVVMPKKTDGSRRAIVNNRSISKNKSQREQQKQDDGQLIDVAEGADGYLDRYPLPTKEVASVHQIRACGSELTGVPDPWLKKLEESPVNELNSIDLNNRPWAERFYHALSQWITDRKKNGSALIPFQSGNKVHDLSLDGDSTTYVLGVPARADDLFDGASVAYVLVIKNRWSNRFIASGAISQVTITVDDDLGDKLGAGHLSIDDTAMSMFLRDLMGMSAIFLRKRFGPKGSEKEGFVP